MKTFATSRPGRRQANVLSFAVAALLGATSSSFGQIFVSLPGSGEGTGIIRDYTAGGSFTTIASGVNIPEGLALNGTDLYVALNRNNGSAATIVKYTAGGGSSVFSTSTGSPATMGLAFDSLGYLYAANTTTATIVKFAPGNGTPLAFASSVGSFGSGPYGLTVDTSFNVYAAIRDLNQVKSYDSSGGLNWSITLAGGSGPVGLALNGSTLFVANHSANTIDTYSAIDGSSLGNFANGADGLNGPFGLSFSGGTLYVANDGGATGSISMFTAAHVSTSFVTSTFPAYITGGVSAIPEPSTYAAIAGAAMLGLAAWRRRRVAPVGE